MNKLTLFAAKQRGNHQYYRLMLMLALMNACFPQQVLAGVALDRSRFVYIVGTKNKQFRLINHNAYPVIVSLWVDSGDINDAPESTTAPLIVTPPMVQLKAKEVTTAKLIDAGITELLPDDRESQLWLNVLEQPPLEKQSTTEHVMAIAMQVQYKVFIRPHSIKPSSDDAFKQVSFRFFSRKQAPPILQLHNPTPYHLSLKQLQILGSCGQKIAINNVHNPYSEIAFTLDNGVHANCIETIKYSVINDEGKTIVLSAPINIDTSLNSGLGG